VTRPAGAAAALAVLVLAAACGSGDSAPAPAAASIPAGLYEFRGVVVAVDRARALLEVDHEAIPGLMPAMTMPYEVADPALLAGIAAGDRVRGTLRVDSRGLVIVALTRG
jgi:Cu/Ag efflux protein CusF